MSTLDGKSLTVTHIEHTAFELGLATVTAVLLLAAVLAATWRWTLSVVARPIRRRLRSVPRRGWLVAVAALAIALEFILATRAQNVLDSFPSGEPGPSATLGYFFEVFSVTLANLARNLSLTLLAVSLACWLWLRCRGGEVPFASGRECGVLGLLYGADVIGLGGQVDGYAAPVAFAIAALGLAGRRGARARWRALGGLRWWLLAGPVAYSLWVVADRNIGGAASNLQPLGLPFLGAVLISQALIWPIAAWCFVVAMPILPGRVGPLKGLVAGLASTVPPALASLLIDTAAVREEWLFVSAELTLLFVAVGFVLDYRSVRAIGGNLRQLGELYNVTSVRAGLAYLAPLALLIFSVVHGLATGSGASAIEGLFNNAGSLIPPGHG